MLFVAENDRLGDFQLQPLRRQAGCLQRRLDERGQRLVTELQGRDIDRHRPGFGPGRRLGAGRLQHPFAERADQAAILGHRDEFAGRDKAFGRVFPAQQGFERYDVGRRHVEQGLEVELELAALHRRLQVLFHLQPDQQLLVHFRLVEAPVVAAFRLDAIERQVGARQQVVHVLGVVRRHGDADADPDLGAHAEQGEGRLHRLNDAPGQQLGILGALDFLDDGEFVAAHAGHDVAFAHALLQPRRDFNEKLVAGQVAIAVIDHLEAVEVEAEQGQMRLMAVRAGQHPLHVLGEQGAVGQAGQRVVVGQVRNLRLGLLLVGQVETQGQDAVGHAVGIAQHGLLQLDDTFIAVAVDETLFLEQDRRLALQRPAVQRVVLRGAFGAEQVEAGLADGVLGIDAQQVLAGRVHQHDALVLGLLDQDHGRDVVDDRVEEGLVPLRLGAERDQVGRHVLL